MNQKRLHGAKHGFRYPYSIFLNRLGHQDSIRGGSPEALQRSYERLSSEVLDAASAPVRLNVLKLLASKGPLPYTEIMYEAKLDPVRDAGKFVYHLKTLRKAGLINIEKGSKKYDITELGKIVVEFSRDLEEYLAVKKGRLFVRTSRMTMEEFDRSRIASSLVTEAGMPQTLAGEVAAQAEERLLKIGTSYLTAPLIRELVNTILVEKKLDEYRHKLTRLGLPVNDVTVLLRDAGQKHLDPSWIQRSAGIAVTGEYVLLNSLPRELVDAHLSGQIHLEGAESWVMMPSKFFHDIRPVLKKGTPGANPPLSLESAMATILRLVRTGEGQTSSGQVFDSFNVLLAPFVKETTVQRVTDAVKLLLYSLNWDGYSNILPSQVTIIIDKKIPEYLGRSSAVGPNGKTAGVYNDYATESAELFRVFLEAAEEISRSIPLVNPSITIRAQKTDSASPDEVMGMAICNAGTRSVPAFLLDDNNHYSVSSDGCVLPADPAKGPGRGAIIGTVLVNVPRASYDAAGKDDRLLQGVMQEVRQAVSALELRRRSVSDRLGEGLLPLFSWSPDGASYYDTRRQSAEVGLLGLDEAIIHHTHSSLDEKDNLGLAKKIIEAARKAVQESEPHELNVRVGLHGSPEAASRLATIDSERYGYSTIAYQGSKKFPYYTDIPGVPLTRKLPLDKRISVEGELQTLLDGGRLFPLVIGQRWDQSGLTKLVQRLGEKGVNHFVFSRMLSRCNKCYHTVTGASSRCENCGADTVTIIGRCSGQLLPLEIWPEAQRRNIDHIVTYDAP